MASKNDSGIDTKLALYLCILVFAPAAVVIVWNGTQGGGLYQIKPGSQGKRAEERGGKNNKRKEATQIHITIHFIYTLPSLTRITLSRLSMYAQLADASTPGNYHACLNQPTTSPPPRNPSGQSKVHIIPLTASHLLPPTPLLLDEPAIRGIDMLRIWNDRNVLPLESTLDQQFDVLPSRKNRIQRRIQEPERRPSFGAVESCHVFFLQVVRDSY